MFLRWWRPQDALVLERNMEFRRIEEVTYVIPEMRPVVGDFSLDKGRKGSKLPSVPERLIEALEQRNFRLELVLDPHISSSQQPHIYYGCYEVGRIDSEANLHVFRNRRGSKELEDFAMRY